MDILITCRVVLYRWSCRCLVTEEESLFDAKEMSLVGTCPASIFLMRELMCMLYGTLLERALDTSFAGRNSSPLWRRHTESGFDSRHTLQNQKSTPRLRLDY